MSPLPRKKRDEPEDQPDDLEIYVELHGYSPEHQNIVAWREDVLIQAGVNSSTASVIARTLTADLHQAATLKAQGCSDRLLLEIMR